MESFPMRHGIIGHVGNCMMTIRFLTIDDIEAFAVAVREVCYVGEKISKVLHLDFKPDDKVCFSAVLDESSEMPSVWKAVAVWTSYKPNTSFKIQDWKRRVCGYYSNANWIGSVLSGDGDFMRKNLSDEATAIEALRDLIISDLQMKSIHNIEGSSLDEILLESVHPSANYIRSVYGSVATFICYHSELFPLSSGGNVFVSKNKTKYDYYIQCVLPLKVQKSNENLDSELSNLVAPLKPFDNKKIYSLEKESVKHFFDKLRIAQEHSGIVYCLSSQKLDKMLELSPELIRFYVRNTYETLKEFLSFHKSVFHIGPCDTIFTATDMKLQMYLTNKLYSLVPDDERGVKEYERLLLELKHSPLDAKSSDCKLKSDLETSSRHQTDKKYYFRNKIMEF